MKAADGGKIKVAHVITRLSLGGAQENTLLTVLGLARRPGYEVTLVVGTPDADEMALPPPGPGSGVRVVQVPALVRAVSPLRDAAALAGLTRLLREGRYHVVHTHMTKAGVLGRVAARRAGTPVVVHTLHGPLLHALRPWYLNLAAARLEAALGRHTHQLLSVSRSLADSMVAWRAAPPGAIRTVYSGMELDWFLDARVDAAAVRRRLGIPGDALVVGTIARLEASKGHDLLFRAIPAIVRAVPGAMFLLVGDGGARARLEARARAEGIAGHVRFAGGVPRERVPEMIAAMDLLVHPSPREGLARVLPQALAMGRPCVALELDGAPEVVVPGETGALVRPGDAEGLARAVVRLLRDPEGRRRMGEAGRRRVDPAFRAETMVEEIAAVYERLLRERGPGCGGPARPVVARDRACGVDFPP